jgi:primosomal protein N' (replication factor Y)
MPEGRKEEYIQVIVPLKLDWCPTYRVPEKWHGSLQVGDRVKVRVGPRLTDAIVSRTGVSPDIDPARIHDIVAREEGLKRITPEEIRLWQFIADYYLCTLGEVFKCAYPSGKIRSEETAAKARERAETSRRKLMEAALQRISKLEAEIEDVKRRTEEALAKLTDRGV